MAQPNKKPGAKPDTSKKNWRTRFMQFFQEMEADDIASPETVMVKADDGTEVSLTLDANGEIACTRADGSTAALQLSMPEAPAGTDEPGPGAGTEAVANPMDVAALRKDFAAKFSKMEKDGEEREKLLMLMAEKLLSQEEQLAEMQDQPAGEHAKGEPASKTQKFSKTEKPTEENLSDLIERRNAERREARLKGKAA